MKTLIVVLLLLGTLTASEAFIGQCKNETRVVGSCKFDYRVCGRVSRMRQWEYETTASDEATKSTATAKGLKTAAEAVEHATKELLEKVHGCNVQSVPPVDMKDFRDEDAVVVPEKSSNTMCDCKCTDTRFVVIAKAEDVKDCDNLCWWTRGTNIYSCFGGDGCMCKCKIGGEIGTALNWRDCSDACYMTGHGDMLTCL